MKLCQREIVFFKTIVNDRGVVTKGSAPLAQVRFFPQADFNSVGLQGKSNFDFSDCGNCHTENPPWCCLLPKKANPSGTHSASLLRPMLTLGQRLSNEVENRGQATRFPIFPGIGTLV